MDRTWKVYAQVYHLEGDEFDVFTRGGQWYGQARRWVGHGNSRETQLIAEYRIRLTDVDEKTMDFNVTRIKTYEF